MNSKLLMMASSVLMGSVGMASLFAPAEILPLIGIPPVSSVTIAVQLLGTLYLAFALTNWTAKEAAIGGIYSRPLSFGNFAHFSIGSSVLLKAMIRQPSIASIPTLIVYTILAIAFGILLFGQGPVRKSANAK